MTQFGSHIKIDRQHRVNLQLCSSGPEVSRYEVYVKSDHRLRKYSYDYNSGLEQLQLEDESEILPNSGGNTYQLLITPDSHAYLTHRISSSEGYLYHFDPDLNLADTIDFSSERPSSPNKLAYSPFDESVFYQGFASVIRKYDKNLNLQWATADSFPNGSIQISKDGHLFHVENSFNTDLYKIDPNDGSNIDYFDVSNLEGVGRTKDICAYPDNRLVVAGVTDNTDGTITIFDTDLNVQKHIILDNVSGVNVSATTGITRLVATPGGNIAMVGIGSPDFFYLFDPISEELVWGHTTFPQWSLGGGRPANIDSDTFGNMVVQIGIGSDTRHVLAVKENGEKIVQENKGDRDSRVIGSHYRDVVNYLD